MDMTTCENCVLFREKFQNAKISKTKTKPAIPLIILEGLPRNGDGSINYEDLLLALNTRKFMEERNDL